MVSVGDVSRELCGGTHVLSTARIRGFKLLSETGIGAGVRRIEAVTGDHMIRHLFKVEEALERAAAAAKARPENLTARIEELTAELREQRNRADKLQAKLFAWESGSLKDNAVDVEGVKVLAQRVEAPDMAALRTQAEQVLTSLGSGVVVFGAEAEGKVNLVTAVSKDLTGRGAHAGKIIGIVAKVVGGGGGGRPDMAQAGGKDPARLDEALAQVVELVRQQLSG
jgi:alanyl-tRNA synthetase